MDQLGGGHAVGVDREVHALLRVALRLSLGHPAGEVRRRVALDDAWRGRPGLQEPTRDGDVVRRAGCCRRHDPVAVHDLRRAGGRDHARPVQAVGTSGALRTHWAGGTLRAHRAGGTVSAVSAVGTGRAGRTRRAGGAGCAVLAVQTVLAVEALQTLAALRALLALRTLRADR